MCQGQTWRRLLRAGGFPWTGVFRAGTVRWERKWEHSFYFMWVSLAVGRKARKRYAVNITNCVISTLPVIYVESSFHIRFNLKEVAAKA